MAERAILDQMSKVYVVTATKIGEPTFYLAVGAWDTDFDQAARWTLQAALLQAALRGIRMPLPGRDIVIRLARKQMGIGSRGLQE